MDSRESALRPLPADDGLGLGRHTLALFAALLLSILLHFGLFCLAAPLRVGTARAEAVERLTDDDLPPLRVATLVQDVAAVLPPHDAAPDPEAAAAQSARETAARAEAAPLPLPTAPALPQPAEAPLPAPPRMPDAGLTPRQLIAAVPDAPDLRDANPTPRWVIDADVPRVPDAPDLADSVLNGTPPSAPALPATEAPGAPASAPGQGPAPLPPPALGTGAVPSPSALGAQALADALAASQTRDAPPPTPIDDRLSLSLTVSEPEADPAHRYFRLEILRRPDGPLAVMPKDVILIQDVSGSIGADRLAAGKTALKAALANTLRHGDRFNVFAFRDNTLTPSDAWLTYAPDTRARAETFIDSLRAVGNTDLFLLLQDLLNLPADPARPLLAVVVTDGEPTVGLTGTTRIIGEFSRMNKGRIAVYAFGTKPRDPYFLDMLCYANRGANATASGDPAALARELAPVFDSIRNPVLKDLSLTFDAQSGGEIHPRNLTHLFADRPLVVYGRAPKGAGHVTCQLRGQGAQGPYDAVFTFDLAQAAPAREDLRAAWARRALFDLLLDYAENPSEALLGRIDSFARAHALPNPYRRR